MRLGRLRGLRALVEEVVEHGSRAVESVHKATAARTFVILEAIPPIAAPARIVHVLHDASLSGVYGSIRLVNQVVAKTLDLALDVAEAEAEAAAAASASASEAPPVTSDDGASDEHARPRGNG